MAVGTGAAAAYGIISTGLDRLGVNLGGLFGSSEKGTGTTQRGTLPHAIDKLEKANDYEAVEAAKGAIQLALQGKRKPTKRGMNEAIGKEVSEKQYNEHETKDRAMSVHAQAEQLTRWLENGWVDLDNEKNVEALTRLAETLDKKLAILA